MSNEEPTMTWRQRVVAKLKSVKNTAKVALAFGLGKIGSVVEAVVRPVESVLDRIPGARYFVKSMLMLIGINLLILPPIMFVIFLPYGLGIAAYAALITIPIYLWLLATSIEPWVSLIIGSLIITGLWMVSDWFHLHYGEVDGVLSELTVLRRGEWPAPPPQVNA